MLEWEEAEDDPESLDQWIAERIDRVDDLGEFLSGLMPSALGADAWAAWLAKSAGNEPPPKVRSARTSNRQALIENRRTIRKLKADKARYEAKARSAEEDLEQAEGVERMILLRLLAQKLIALSGPRFKMGPAWTVLRAIAFPKYRLPQMMRDYGKEKFVEIIEFLDRLPRPDETATSIWRTLFFNAGEPEFESRLHVAVAEVCREFDPGPNWNVNLALDESSAEARTQFDDDERLEFLSRLSFVGDDPRPRPSKKAG
jgi:hypothetical protein